MRVITNLWFALAMSVSVLVAAVTFAAATVSTDWALAGTASLGLSAGAGGCYFGSMARKRYRHRHVR
ncbi:hypothetical protein ASF23_11820 [Curtobacterium sp. Leaf261]|nr:hypothetical protein ASF23_11820 [Curtobacterium sp. Leaf261]